MKNKVRVRVLRRKRICFFCGKTATSKHHIIPRRIGGSGKQNNKVDVCDNCHAKLHKLLDPVVDYLLVYLKDMQDKTPKPMNPIGFRYRNGKKVK